MQMENGFFFFFFSQISPFKVISIPVGKEIIGWNWTEENGEILSRRSDFSGGEGDRKNSVDPLLLACFSNASEIIRNALNWAPVESQNPAAKLFLPRSTDRLANVQESLSLSLFSTQLDG